MAAPDAPREVPEGLLFHMQIHRADLKAKELIGEGEFGSVYLATQKMRRCMYTGKLFAIDGLLKRHMEAEEKKGTKKIHKQVDFIEVVRAVKMLKGASNKNTKEEFFKEANITLMFDHPNCAKICGVAVQQAPQLIALEYCEYGDLRSVLKGCKQKGIFLNQKEQFHMCIGLSEGMAHIASKRLVCTYSPCSPIDLIM